jgi:hypothetical protein
MEGKRQVQRQLKHYNVDAIISVGYRVNSRRVSGSAECQVPPMGNGRFLEPGVDRRPLGREERELGQPALVVDRQSTTRR